VRVIGAKQGGAGNWLKHRNPNIKTAAKMSRDFFIKEGFGL
jgi:hypothetical protein